MRKAIVSAFAALLLGGALSTASQAAILDPVGDFLATYEGPQNGDMDLLSASAVQDGFAVTLATVANGQVGTTVGGFHAWGVNRGAGTAGLFQSTMPQIGPGVLHDAVVILRPNATGTVVLVGAGGALSFFQLPSSAISPAGNSITGVVPFSLLPSTGFAFADYTYTAWTRSGTGSNSLVGDFAPENAPFRAAVPEPGAWALMILGFGAVGALLRRRYSATSTASTLPPSFSMRRAPARMPGNA
jgi:hypothetical protein